MRRTTSTVLVGTGLSAALVLAALVGPGGSARAEDATDTPTVSIATDTSTPTSIVLVTPSPSPSPSPSQAPAAPAAGDPLDQPVFTVDPVWFHGGGSRVGNAQGAQQVNGVPTWDRRKPTSSQPLGAGAAYADVSGSTGTTGGSGSGPYDPRYAPTWSGNHAGDIDVMGLELYAYLPGLTTEVVTADVAVGFDLSVDGVSMLRQPQDMPSGGFTATKTASPGLYRMKIALKNIYKVSAAKGVDKSDAKTHQVLLSLTTSYLGRATVLVFDSMEAPAGATFNLSSLSGYDVVDITSPPPPPALPPRV